jgi:hypothetical protein
VSARVAIAVVALAGCGRMGFDAEPALRCPGPASGWDFADGYRGAVLTAALDDPTGVAVAGDAFGDQVYVANTGNTTVTAIDPATGGLEVLVPTLGWPSQPVQLTALVWDATGVFDGSLYVADRGTSADGDGAVYAIDPDGTTRVTMTAGPALDDVYGLAFVDDPGYGTGLLVAGDTDTVASPDWARYDATGAGSAFSELEGTSGIAVDTRGTYGGGVFASRPSNSSFAGDGSITKLASDGTPAGTLVTNSDSIHAVAIAPPGAFHGWMYAATGNAVVAIDPGSAVTPIATGAWFEDTDGNVIAFSRDGAAMYVVDRRSDRVVCIEAGVDPAPPDAAPPPGGGAAAIGE